MPDAWVVRLSGRVRAAIEEEARRRYPEECCGGLLGREDGEGRRIVIRALPGSNERTEHRERRYLLAPRDVLRMQSEADDEGLEVLGFFHSHPDHPAVPSETDRSHAWPWYSYLIVSVRGGEPDDLRSWRMTEEDDGFREETIELPAGS